MKGQIIFWIAVSIVVLAAWIKLSDKIFGNTQLQEAQQESSGIAIDNVTEYLIEDGLSLSITAKQAVDAAIIVRDSIGIFTNDESMLMSGIHVAKLKDDGILINIAFKQLYQADMIAFVNDRVDNVTAIEFNNYINNLN